MRYSLAAVELLTVFLLCSELCEGKSHYDVLGVSTSSSAKAITKKYRELARKFHPDKNKDDPNAQAKFIELSQAYEILGNETKRRVYDHDLKFGGVDEHYKFNEEEVFSFRTADGRVFTRSARQQVRT